MVTSIAGAAGDRFYSTFCAASLPPLYTLNSLEVHLHRLKSLAELPIIDVLNPLSIMLLSPWIALSYWMNTTFKKNPF